MCACWKISSWNSDKWLFINNPNKNIALCRIDTQYSEPGTEVEVGKIDGHQKRISAKVVVFPHFDPKKTRVRS